MQIRFPRAKFGGVAIAAALITAFTWVAPDAYGETKVKPYTPPQAIVTKHVPEVSRTANEGLSPYENIRSAGFSDWHPTQRQMLISTRFGSTRQLHEVTNPLGTRRQLTFFSEPVGGGSYRPGKPEQITFGRDAGGSENFQLFLFDRNSGDVRMLSDGIHRHVGGTWSDDGRWIATAHNGRNGKDMDIYVIDPDKGEQRRLTEMEGSWFPVEWSPDSKSVLILRYISVSETQLALVDAASGAVSMVTPKEPKAAYFGGSFSADGKSIYVVTQQGSEFRRLVQMPLDGGDVKVLSGDILWDVEGFTLTDDGELLAFSINEGGISRFHLMETATGKQLPVPDLPEGVAGGASFRPGTHELGFSISWARSPSDVYSYDCDTGKMERWTASEAGGLNTESFAVPELVKFASFDDRKIPAFVYRPDPKRFPGPRPVYINIHGGPEGQFRPRFLGSNNYLVDELGIVMVFPNVRGSAGYGKTYLNLDNGFQREDSVKDIGALLDWVDGQSDLDNDRVMVGGGSYGGYMTLASMVFYSDRLRAGYDVVGISNFVTFLKNTQSYRRDLRRAEYGDERDPAMLEFLEKIAPANRVEKITKPLLVAQGANDPRVPLSESDQIVAALEKNGTPVWYVVAEDEGHGFRKKPNSDYMRVVWLEFIQRYLLPETPVVSGIEDRGP